ncbi:MAG TPA: PTS sugar transporter subunit IIC [Syntrophomonas sp.]|nr:PTS sugar transporter subunit IIC [Syntrophomonas sp.]
MHLEFWQILLLTLWSGLSIVDQMTFNLGINGIIQTGIFAGIVTGNPLLGLIVGGTLQSYALGIGAYGGASVPNWPAAAIIVTALAGSLDNMASTIAIVGIPVAALTVQMDILGRFANVVFQHRGNKYAALGNAKQVKISNTMGLASWLISRMVPVFVALLIGPALIITLTQVMPAWLVNGFVIVSKLFPAVGFSILLRYLPTKNNIQYLIVGFALVAWFSAPILGVTAIGLALAITVFRNNSAAVATEGADYDE